MSDLPYSAQGGATVIAPAEGFAASGLAQMFGSTFVVPSPALPSDPPERHAPKRVRRVVIAGASLGGAVFLGLIVGITWIFWRSVHRMLIGDLSERLEIDGRGRHNSELEGNAVCWELWSPTVSPETEVDQFKFETKGDRDLSWRGETECNNGHSP